MIQRVLHKDGRWVVKPVGVAEPESQAASPTHTGVTATTLFRRVLARRLAATAKASMMEAPMAVKADEFWVVLFSDDSTEKAPQELNDFNVRLTPLRDALREAYEAKTGRVVVVERTLQADPGKEGTIGNFTMTLATERFTTLPPLIVTENDAGPSLSDLINEARR